MVIDTTGITSQPELSRALEELRVAAGLSYHGLATAADIGTTTVYDMLKGASVPRWVSLELVLRALGIRDPKELAEWRQARQRAARAKRERDSGDWPGPGTAIRITAADGHSLGVHRAIAEPGLDPDSLPPYVWRDDDDSGDGVRATVTTMAREGGFLVLVGGSSVGKTRTLYEAVRALVPDWWLLQPGSADEVRDLAGALSPDTRLVVWLDELQDFLGGARGLDAVTIRGLLRGPGRVLLAGTLWPVYHSAYAVRPDGSQADPYATERAVMEQARVLRLGDFSDAERQRAQELGDDPRIHRALSSPDHGFTQTMAAGPQLITRWRDADPYAAAVINAALDAARLGVWHPLPADLLRQAAPGYCDNRARADAGESGDWFNTALAYARATVHGAASPLIAIAGEEIGVITGYRPADYLLQHAARERGGETGPRQLWDALTEHVTDLEDLGRLAMTARIQCLDRLAVVLLKRAVLLGDPDAPTYLLGQLYHLSESRPGEWHVPADAVAWAVRHAAVTDPRAVAHLMDNLREPGDVSYRAELAERACQHVPTGDPEAVSACLRALNDAGERDAALLLADRAAREAPVEDPESVSRLWETMDKAGAVTACATLAARASSECTLRPFAVRQLFRQISSASGTEDAYETLIGRIAAQAPVSDPSEARHFLELLLEKEAGEAAGILAGRAARDASLDDPRAVASLVKAIRAANADAALESLADRAARQAPLAGRGLSLGQDGIDQVILALERAGALQRARALAERAARDAPLTAPGVVHDLLEATAHLISDETRQILIARTAAGTSTNPWVYFRHIGALEGTGASEAARVLADRGADLMTATEPDAITCVLAAMKDIGADEAARRFSERAARDVSLGPYIEPERLVQALRSMDEGSHKAQAEALADRIARDFPLDDPARVGRLVRELASPDWEQLQPRREVARPVRVFGRAARALGIRAARDMPLIDLYGICDLLGKLKAVCGEEASDALIARMVSQAPARRGLDRFLHDLHEAGDTGSVRLLADRTARHAPADEVDLICALLKTMARIGADDAAGRLAARAAQEAPIILPGRGYSPRSTDMLLAALQDVGGDGPTRALADRAADLAPLDEPAGIARLLTVLNEAGHHEQARRLAGRAARGAVLDPAGILDLLPALDETGAASMLPTLAMRVAQHVSVEDATQSARLVWLLREIGVPGTEKTLLARIARRHFGLYLNLAGPDQRELFKYGREPDGTPSAPWTWDTLP